MQDDIQHNGDDNFSAVFKRYYNSLLVYAIRYVGDNAIAEDIVQDVFIQLWKRFDELSRIEYLRSYLFTAVHNGVCNFLKHKKIKDNYAGICFSARDKLEQYYRQQIQDKCESLLAKELENQIAEIIQSLPEACKKVFILSRKNHLKNKEIAEILEIDIKTVEKHITKALLILRKRLENYL